MPNKHGFTLVELAVVLVVIGLLVGGVMAGKNLIRAAQLKTITTEKATYQKAIQTFYDTYMSLPGDMYNATDMWGAAANCPGTTTQGTTDGTTCSGDGDGKVENTNTGGSSNHDGNPNSNEWFRAWQHLANAGLISGSYNGVTGPGHVHASAVVGVNVPASNFANAGWTARWINPGHGNSDLFVRDYKHILILGGEISDNNTGAPFLSPKEIYNIDKKMDDGKPSSGSVGTHWLNECTNASGNTDYTADYLLSEENEVCAIIFIDAF